MFYSAEIIRLAQGKVPPPTGIDIEGCNKIACRSDQLIHYSMRNPLCGDKVEWYATIDDDAFTDLYFLVTGCLLCRAATNHCYQLFNGQFIKKIGIFNQNHGLSRNRNDIIQDFGGDMTLFSSLKHSPNRQQCVCLPFIGLDELIQRHHLC